MFIDIIDFPNYEINELGEVRNKTTGVMKKSTMKSTGYWKYDLYKNNNKKYLYIHRLIALHFISNPDNLPQVDHINGIRTDNRIENLRWVTNQQNQWNRNSKGYSIARNGKYYSQIHQDGKSIYLGTYDTEEEAHQAYLNKAEELRGDFVHENKILSIV